MCTLCIYTYIYICTHMYKISSFLTIYSRLPHIFHYIIAQLDFLFLSLFRGLYDDKYLSCF